MLMIGRSDNGQTVVRRTRGYAAQNDAYGDGPGILYRMKEDIRGAVADAPTPIYMAGAPHAGEGHTPTEKNSTSDGDVR